MHAVVVECKSLSLSSLFYFQKNSDTVVIYGVYIYYYSKSNLHMQSVTIRYDSGSIRRHRQILNSEVNFSLIQYIHVLHAHMNENHKDQSNRYAFGICRSNEVFQFPFF